MTTRDDCVAADAADPLRDFRAEFALPDGVVYLDGNSLGARPVGAAVRAAQVVTEEWGRDLIGSWNTAGWFDLPQRLGDQLSELIGGGPGETVVTDTTSTNLFKMLAAAVRIAAADHPDRRLIVSERDNFPTDLYLAEGLIELLDRGYRLELVDPGSDGSGPELAALLAREPAVVMLSHVNYRTGACWDLGAVTAAAHAAGALVIWDLAHSAGAMPIGLGAADADFAVGCTYKYLNGGPGAPAFCWVHPRHHERFVSPLSGWWGHARPFAMESSYAPGAGITKALCGTQPIVSLTLVECGLDIARRADLGRVRAKSIALGELMIALVRDRCGGHPLELITPRDPEARGSHLSFAHPHGFPVMQALIERGVVGDYREPDVLRFGLTPLYLGFADVWDAVEILRDVLDRATWDQPRFHRRATVT